MPLFLNVCASILIFYAVYLLIPGTKEKRIDNLRITFGFGKLQSEALTLGIELKKKHYFFILLGALILGVTLATVTNNLLFIGIGAACGYFVPTIIISKIRYARRKEMLLNMPSNLRLLQSQFRDHKSIQRSLEMSLPMMSGVTAPLFRELYLALRLQVDQRTALSRMKEKVNFNKFNDYCSKLLLGSRDGFHARSLENMQKTINEMVGDVDLLLQLELENRSKRNLFYIIFGMAWIFPFLFYYFELQSVSELHITTTLGSPSGRVLVAIFTILTLVAYVRRDKYTRLNLDSL
ncbi:hypothetical protein ACIFOE_04920 [Paenibacillus sp. NRS-1783]|uniref:hypothetical protein n=1 Tax=Paenibacillus sp. NRS-1783 TaxID=3233907 RepID=UPI003D2A86A6